MSDPKDLKDDPWARWRQAPAAEERAKPAASVSPAAAPAEPPAGASEPAPAEKPAPTTGTLSPRRVVKAAPPPVERRPRAPGKPAGNREGAPRSGQPRRSADGPRPERERTENPWGKPRGEAAAGKSGWREGGERDGARPARRQDGSSGAAGKNAGFSRSTVKSGQKPSERPAAPRPAPAVAGPASDAPPPSGVRLSKVMSERGICSRREADLWIERGWVFVDGQQVAELGARIDPSAAIEVSQDAQKDQARQVTILLHKPVGYVSGQPEPGMTPAVALIGADNQVRQGSDPEFQPWMLRHLAPAGRLDVDSTGLLVLTQDGRVAKKLIGEDSQVDKEYLVRVSGQMIPGGLDLLRHGLELDGKPLKQAWVKQLNEDQLHFILKEGKKRQIRRMCELVGLKVIGLKRVRIGRVRLGDLPLGQWRLLRPDEAF